MIRLAPLALALALLGLPARAGTIKPPAIALAPRPVILPANIPLDEFSPSLPSAARGFADHVASAALDGLAALTPLPVPAAARMPEPASLALIAIGLIGLAATRRVDRNRVSRRCRTSAEECRASAPRAD